MKLYYNVILYIVLFLYNLFIILFYCYLDITTLSNNTEPRYRAIVVVVEETLLHNYYVIIKKMGA